MYTEREIREFRVFLEEKTTYDVNLIFATKSINQIAAMCKRIEEAMKKYSKEIIEYLTLHSDVVIPYDKSELHALTYNELIEIRKQLGIKKTKKKVVKTEKATSQPQLAIDFIESQKTSRLCVSIMQNNEDREPQILTEDEIKQMYGGEELTPEELAERGIISDTIREEDSTQTDRDEERYNMIDFITENDMSVTGKNFTFSFLCSLSEDELKSLVSVIQMFKEYDKRNERSLKK